MDIERIVYEAMEHITGVSQEDFAEYQNLDLIDSGILDSLSIANLLTRVSKKVGRKIHIEDMNREDFSNMRALIQAIAKLT